ncbi:MAG: hypothetical protein PHV99_00155 [Candidatus Pacebacteria bacterium]|nr:hypothetical protein [Candidatus Paceibacterota bacterium]
MTFAQYIGSGTTGIVGVLNSVVAPIIFAFAFLAFIWGVVNYFFLHGDNETSRKEGRQFILWGIIGMVVFISIFGFVNILLSALGLTPK